MFENGPYLQAALLCERALLEQDGTVSLIRIIGRASPEWSFQLTPGELIDEETGESRPATEQEREDQRLVAIERLPMLSVAIFLISGEATGQHSIQVRITGPNGEERGTFDGQVEFADDPASGAGIVSQLNIQGEDPTPDRGVYWFDVMCDGEPLTRFPLRVDEGLDGAAQ